MRIFHVSEEPNIKKFVPRSYDTAGGQKLVWAIDEERLPNYLLPRDYLRVTYHISPHSLRRDAEKFFTSGNCRHAVVIEGRWLERVRHTTLYLYEFDPAAFRLYDRVAGYYVSERTREPVNIFTVADPLARLIHRNVEIRIVDSLWDIAGKIQQSSLNYSFCRMSNASKPDAFGRENTRYPPEQPQCE